VTARQYPPPHQHVVQARCPAAEWALLDAAIATSPDSYLAYFRGYQWPMRYWEFEGRRYWRTSSRGPERGVTHMLNRCLFDDAEPPRRVDQGAAPITDWARPPVGAQRIALARVVGAGPGRRASLSPRPRSDVAGSRVTTSRTLLGRLSTRRHADYS